MPVKPVWAWTIPPRVLELVGVLLIVTALALVTWLQVTERESMLNTAWRSYERVLGKLTRESFLTVQPKAIATAQGLLLLLTAAFAPVLGARLTLLSVVVVAVVPILQLKRRRRQRLRALEAQVEPFLLALTNALRSSASIGSALAITESVVGGPMRQELGLVLKELRVGSSVDQALLGMAARTRVAELDAALSAVLIGRQVGGNLTHILETTAKTLREMARLLAVVRGKTNSGRVQFTVLALAPFVVVVGFEAASPGYFEPLLHSVLGGTLLVVAATSWLVAIGLARKILAVSP